MRRPAIHRFQRTLAALLWLLASFAFMTRQQDMPASMDMSGMLMGGTANQAAPLTEKPMTEPEMAQMDSPAEQAGQGVSHLPAAKPTAAQLSTAHDHQTKTHNANAPPAPTPDTPNQQGHAGHCPFCFTAAFALTASPVELPAPEYVQTAHQLASIPTAPRPLLGSKRARAPPLG
ncbi:hypothetical protein EHF33_00675 [Deinococcus psychrotolerans]|uniref:DUF2946 domain-containing protein n=1 Tax=Deinococcus psychrotolerans TaxID=2489213 RepID=A0A3G8Y7U4_9DEIO|nr:hypothetical protein [Deinococcus psychrotolerans]AZI41449.1 hypothetical protein EHF33_00675 [Deinococcus psychrotolerans]